MSMLFQGMQTPTEVRIRKSANDGYIVEYVLFDPHAAQSCQRHGVKGEVYADLNTLLESVGAYLHNGKGCLCDDCDHAHRPS
jgi:hypothetical protein